MSRTLSAVVLDKMQLESRQSAVKQQVGMEEFVCRGLVSQLLGVISTEAVAMVGEATSIRTAVIATIKIDFMVFLLILCIILI